MIESQNAQGYDWKSKHTRIFRIRVADAYFRWKSHQKYNQNQESSSVHPQELLFAQTVNMPLLMRIV